jgi:hypothetical protein
MTMPAFDGVENITWDFGDGNTSNEAAPSHTWENNTGELMAATVTFSAQTENGCTGTTSTEVFIKPQPVAEFSTDFDNGCEPWLASLATTAQTQMPSIGTSETEMFPMTNQPKHGILGRKMRLETFTVTLTATDDLGCFDTATQNVTVHPGADFAHWISAMTLFARL